MQNDEAYRRQLHIAARADAEEGIRQGLENAKNGRLRLAKEVFAEFEATHGISRD
jgi:CHASE2 domain-containing sensor protein